MLFALYCTIQIYIHNIVLSSFIDIHNGSIVMSEEQSKKPAAAAAAAATSTASSVDYTATTAADTKTDDAEPFAETNAKTPSESSAKSADNTKATENVLPEGPVLGVNLAKPLHIQRLERSVYLEPFLQTVEKFMNENPS